MNETLHPSVRPGAVVLRRAREGKRSFPCDQRTKAPLIGGGFKAATCDEATLRRWWSAHPDALIGEPTGDGVAVLDIDPRNGGVEPAGLPRTKRTRTRSGGWHIWMCVPAGQRVPCSAGKIARGVDIRGDGGYVIADSPGWAVVDDSPIAPMPDWLLAAALGRPRRAGTRGRRGYGPRFQSIPDGEVLCEGGRNDHLARYLGHCLASPDVTAADLAALAHAENARVCVPPLPHREVEQVAASIGRYEGREQAPSGPRATSPRVSGRPGKQPAWRRATRPAWWSATTRHDASGPRAGTNGGGTMARHHVVVAPIGTPPRHHSPGALLGEAA